MTQRPEKGRRENDAIVLISAVKGGCHWVQLYKMSLDASASILESRTMMNMDLDDIELSQTALERGIIMMESGSMVIMVPDDEVSQTALESGIIVMKLGSMMIMEPDDIQQNQTTLDSGVGLRSATY